MAITTVGWKELADIFTGESADTITKLKIGYGSTAESLGDTDLVHAYTDGGFEVATITPTYVSPVLTFTHTFTNTSGVARTVREVGLYTTSGGVLVYRKAYTSLHGINNFCVVRNGDDITVTITLTLQDNEISKTLEHDAGYEHYELNTYYTITITPACTTLIEGVTQAKMKIGYGYTAVSGSDTDCEHPYSDYGFEPNEVVGNPVGNIIAFHTLFISTNATERAVREVALFTLADEFLCRYVYDEQDIENLCIVPPDKQIDIDVTLTFTSSAYTTYSSVYATGDIDLTTFSHPGPIDYNGIVLPNASVLPYRDAMGKKVWQFKCSTKVVADREKAIRYAGPISTGRSATGKQYVISSYRSGVLYISGDSTYYNVYMAEPVEVETFGKTYFFTITIYESAYPEVV